MANASRDQNGVPTLLAVLNTDGQSVVPVGVVSASHTLFVTNGTTGTDNGPGDRAVRDENSVTTMIGVSSVDGVTPVAVYADADGNLLIDSE